MTAQTWGGWITLLGIAVTLVGLVAVHLLPTGISPLRDPVSQYHLTPYRGWIATSTISAGVAGIGAILALVGLLGSRAVVSSVLLGVFVAARVLIPFLRMDAPGTPVTTVGRIHTVLAFGAFGAATAVAFVAGGALHDAGFLVTATWSSVFGIVMAVGALGVLASRLTRRAGLFGFFERLIYVGFISWFVMIGVVALTA